MSRSDITKMNLRPYNQCHDGFIHISIILEFFSPLIKAMALQLMLLY